MAASLIPEAEASRDLHALLVRVSVGEKIEIGSDLGTFLLTPSDAAVVKLWTLSDAIRRAEADPSEVTLDDRFGADLEQIIRQRDDEFLGDQCRE